MKFDIIADITLFPAEKGGRRSPTPASFFGCILSIENKNYDCRMVSISNDPMNPGHSYRVKVKFLDYEAKKNFKSGCTFNIREINVIGKGINVSEA